MFSGCLVALITPFKEGEVDYAELRELVDWHVEQGTDGLVPCGTTGESPTLSFEEHEKVIVTVVEQVGGRIPVVAGTGSNNTAEALRLTRFAKEAGADGVLMITPYYNKPTQEGMYRHFQAVAEEVDIPLVLYNVPGRTGVNLAPETVARLAEAPNIVAVKEASGSLDQASAIASLCDITILSGDDSLTLPLLSVGCAGVISVVGNIVPRDMKAMIEAFQGGHLERARRLHLKLFPLCRAMFLETNPIPVNTAMKMLGRTTGEIRLPLCEMAEANRAALRRVLTDYGLLK